MDFEITNYVLLTGILIIIGLYLHKWEPPIKKQYIALAMLVVGSGLGYLMVDNLAYGFVLAGFVFYKDELVEEAKLVKNSFHAVTRKNNK